MLLSSRCIADLLCVIQYESLAHSALTPHKQTNQLVLLWSIFLSWCNINIHAHFPFCSKDPPYIWEISHLYYLLEESQCVYHTDGEPYTEEAFNSFGHENLFFRKHSCANQDSLKKAAVSTSKPQRLKITRFPSLSCYISTVGWLEILFHVVLALGSKVRAVTV